MYSAKKKAEISQTDWIETTVEKLCNAFYVYNCVTREDSKIKLKTFVQESIANFASGEFDLRGWEITNDSSKNESTLVLGMI